MNKEERKITKEKRDSLAIQTVQTALNEGFSIYDIEKLAASITCLARFQKLQAKEVDTENLPLEWNF